VEHTENTLEKEEEGNTASNFCIRIESQNRKWGRGQSFVM